MYNRYVPQSDGSFQRSWVPETRPHPAEEKPKPKSQPSPPCPSSPEPSQTPQNHHKHESVGGFLQQLLPKNFDTGDLIVVLLLLLLAGDCEEDRSSALLTLALYLFL